MLKVKQDEAGGRYSGTVISEEMVEGGGVVADGGDVVGDVALFQRLGHFVIRVVFHQQYSPVVHAVPSRYSWPAQLAITPAVV
jgi:hypothetical protein